MNFYSTGGFFPLFFGQELWEAIQISIIDGRRWNAESVRELFLFLQISHCDSDSQRRSTWENINVKTEMSENVKRKDFCVIWFLCNMIFVVIWFLLLLRFSNTHFSVNLQLTDWNELWGYVDMMIYVQKYIYLIYEDMMIEDVVYEDIMNEYLTIYMRVWGNADMRQWGGGGR